MNSRRPSSRRDAPLPIRPTTSTTGSKVFDTLPFPPRDPVENRMVLSNAFAFGLISFNDRLRRLLMVAPLREELLGAA